MEKIILICGKICSGKTTYAKHLMKDKIAVLLSLDEITLALFGQHLGDKHEEITKKTATYLYNKSVEIIKSGINVVLDWGFWTYEQRQFTSKFYTEKGINIEWHYVDVSDIVWHQNINMRNKRITKRQDNFYFIDENLLNKSIEIFEMPNRDEMDVWYINSRSLKTK